MQASPVQLDLTAMRSLEAGTGWRCGAEDLQLLAVGMTLLSAHLKS